MTRKRAALVRQTGVKPAWSQVTLESTAHGFRVILPAVGLGRRRKEVPWLPAQSLFWVGGILCFFAVLLTVFFLALPQLVTHNTVGGELVIHAPNDLVVPWPVWAGLVGLWGIVLASMLAGFNLCRCHGIVEVADGFLRVEQANLFGRRQRQWPCEEIVAVQTGPTGLTIGGGTSATGVTIPGGTRVPELHLYAKDGKRMRLFAGRSEEELDWIARELRQALQLGTRITTEGEPFGPLNMMFRSLSFEAPNPIKVAGCHVGLQILFPEGRSYMPTIMTVSVSIDCAPRTVATLSARHPSQEKGRARAVGID
jgi:hypothetical protein